MSGGSARMVRRWVIAALSLLLAWQALADGKAFPMVADPLADASSTMPRQRAIIAWDGTEQRLAIDTAFTGKGAEFAWLVPLPSEPEISPATKGMFDTAAVLASPRLKRTAGQGWLIGVGIAVLLMVFAAMSGRGRAARVVGVLFFSLLAVVFLLPAMGKPRGSASGPTTVQIIDQSTAGLYDTTVLRAERAADLLAWLTGNGYGVPEGVEPVVQAYLDKGWCFAAARLSVDAPGDGEHRAHPLQFRFAVEEPVYPMALTAVGNGDIELELFVFADGSARADHMRVACSLEVQINKALGDPDLRARDVHRRPALLSHPGLIEIAGDLPVLTRLHAVLSPAEQADDLPIEIVPFRERDPELYTSAGRWALALNVGLGVAIVGGVVLVVARLIRARGDVVAGRGTLAAVGGVVVLGLVAAGAVAVVVPVYGGAITSGRTPYSAEQALSSAGRFLAEYAEREGVRSEAEVRALLPAMAPQEYWDHIGEGDSPLHFRFEPGDSDASIWFIWHDAIGGEHRSLVPLDAREPLG